MNKKIFGIFIVFILSLTFAFANSCTKSVLLEKSDYAIEGNVLNIICSNREQYEFCLGKVEFIKNCNAKVEITNVLKGDFNVNSIVQVPFTMPDTFFGSEDSCFPDYLKTDFELNNKIQYYSTSLDECSETSKIYKIGFGECKNNYSLTEEKRITNKVKIPRKVGTSLASPNDDSELEKVIINEDSFGIDEDSWRYAYYSTTEDLFWIVDFPGNEGYFGWYGPFDGFPRFCLLDCLEIGASIINESEIKCCEGLALKKDKSAFTMEDSGVCNALEGANKICIPCGDGVCDSRYESYCNCSQDCAIEHECAKDSDCDDNDSCTLDSCEGFPRECSSRKIRDGCKIDGKCLPFKAVVNEQYCSQKYILENQREGGETCSANFECLNDNCVNNVCYVPGFIEQILNWIMSFFGG